jgi:hypothetical protein
MIILCGLDKFFETAFPAYSGAAFLRHFPSMPAPEDLGKKRPQSTPGRFSRVDGAFFPAVEKDTPAVRPGFDIGFAVPVFTVRLQEFPLGNPQKTGDTRSLTFLEDNPSFTVTAVSTSQTFKNFHFRLPANKN